MDNGIYNGLLGLVPAGEGPLALSEQERRAVLQQGLLSAGLGILANNRGNPSQAIGRGLLGGLGQLQQGAEGLQAQRYKALLVQQGLAGPAGAREFEAFTRAGNLSPEDRAQAARIHLGLEGPASRAGFGFGTITDAQRRELPTRQNPRTGQYEVLNPNTGLWVPMGGLASAPAAPPAGVDAMFAQMTRMSAQGVPDAEIEAWARQNAPLFGVQLDAPAGPPAGGTPLPAALSPFADTGGLQIGARPGDIAAQEQAAREAVTLGNLPLRSQLEAQGAAQRVAAEAGAKRTSAAQTDLPKALAAAEQTVALIDQALAHPGLATATGLSGLLDPRNLLPGTAATDFRVLLDQLQGKAFLEAFESLKGGGQITEVEGRKATEAIARLNRAQSDQAFRQALGELRDIALAGKARAEAAASGAPTSAPTSAVESPPDIEALLEKYR